MNSVYLKNDQGLLLHPGLRNSKVVVDLITFVGVVSSQFSFNICLNLILAFLLIFRFIVFPPDFLIENPLVGD